MSAALTSRPTKNRTPLWGRVLGWASGPVPVSVVLAFVIGALFITLAGSNPVDGYAAMLTGSLTTGLGVADTLNRAVYLIGMALAVAVAFRAGVLNLGAEGQMILGGLAGGVIALSMPGPGWLVCLVACAVGAATGAAWGALAAGLNRWPGVPILLTTLLLNYPARFFASWVIRFQLKDPESSQVATHAIDSSRQIPLLAAQSSSQGQWLVENFGKDHVLTQVGRTANWSLLVVIVMVVAVAFMNRRTVYGFESGVNGHNPTFAQYSGVRTGWMTTRTMLLSGGIAGLVGVMFTIGAPSIRIVDGVMFNTNYAWTGLLVALLAFYRPSGVVLAGVFFAAIAAGSNAMGRDLSMSPQIASVIQGIVIILIAFRVSLPQKWRDWLGGGGRRAGPAETVAAADGEPDAEPARKEGV